MGCLKACCGATSQPAATIADRDRGIPLYDVVLLPPDCSAALRARRASALVIELKKPHMTEHPTAVQLRIFNARMEFGDPAHGPHPAAYLTPRASLTRRRDRSLLARTRARELLSVSEVFPIHMSRRAPI